MFLAPPSPRNTLLSGNTQASGAPRAPRPCWILGSTRGVSRVVRRPWGRACTLAPTPLDVVAIRQMLRTGLWNQRGLYSSSWLSDSSLQGVAWRQLLGRHIVRPGRKRRPGEQSVLGGCAQPITSFSWRLVFDLQVDF